MQKRRRSLFSDPVYNVLCSAAPHSYIQMFQNFKLPQLVDYPTKEQKLRGNNSFNLSGRGGFSDIRLSIDDLTKIDKIFFRCNDSSLLELDGPILNLIYGEDSIITLSEVLSCSRNQPIISEIHKFELEIFNRDDANIELTLLRTDDYREYKVKQDKYPLYKCKNQNEVNLLFAQKLNELTSIINSGTSQKTELIQIENKNQSRKLYYDENSDRNIFPCIEYRSYKFFANDYVDISRNAAYFIGFYIYLENFSNVFDFVDSIWIRINDSVDFEFVENDCFKYRKYIFVSLVAGFTNNKKPWLIEDWLKIFENNAIPNFKKERLEVKIVFKNDTKCEGFIIPISINARMYGHQSLVRLFY